MIWLVIGSTWIAAAALVLRSQAQELRPVGGRDWAWLVLLCLVAWPLAFVGAEDDR